MIANLLCCAVLLAASLAQPTVDNSTAPNASPIPPKQDPFYTAPADFELAPPGAILRIRRAPGNLTSIYNASADAYNIVYRTTNSRYEAAWSVTTLFAPKTAPSYTEFNSSLLSYQIPYNTANLDASPSYSLYNDLATALVLSDIQTALGYGWYVSVPDFEGPTTSFASGVAEGHAVIDSIRAVTSSKIGSLSSSTRYAMWGYSGGSLASEWAAELAVQYAPELRFSGMAIGGMAPNITDVILNIDDTSASGLIPALILGLTNQFPEAYEYLLSQLKTSGPYNRTGFLATQNYSIATAFAAYSNQSVLQNYFTNGQAVLQNPLITKALDTVGQLGYHGVPNMPVYAYKAIQDEYSLVADTDNLIQRYCSVGVNITYRRNTIGNHLDEYFNGDAGALSWLRRQLEGPLPSYSTSSSCSIQNVTDGTFNNPPFAPGL